ncbi:MAG TPA: DinB family protein, partial [Chloroflexota bacterium]|nr:DinB family protein [Chloroflexota bacterium]
MNVEEIASLLAYNRWANERLLALAARVPPDSLRQRFGGGADSLHGTFAHVLNAEILWLRRCRGEAPPGGPKPLEFSDLSALQARWET